MILTFDNDELSTRRFEFVFVGFVLGGSLVKEKGMDVLRREVALFEKLENISELRPCGKKLVNGEPDRRLKNGDGSKALELSPQEYDLLYHYIALVPWHSGSPGKHALDVLDWLAQTERAGRGRP